jgi:hypothetical protein
MVVGFNQIFSFNVIQSSFNPNKLPSLKIIQSLYMIRILRNARGNFNGELKLKINILN